MITLIDYVKTLNERTVEVRYPNPKLRHDTEVKYVFHRFPVKNGITPREHFEKVTLPQFNSPNKLLDEFVFVEKP